LHTTIPDCVLCTSCDAQSVAEHKIVALVDKHLHQVLYQEKTTQWKMSTDDLTFNNISRAVGRDLITAIAAETIKDFLIMFKQMGI